MSEIDIMHQAAPTLAGIKAGSLFNCPYHDHQSLVEDCVRLNRILVPKGIRLVPIRILNDRVLVYVYRSKDIEKILSDKQVEHVLEQYGYTNKQPTHCVAHLVHRLQEDSSFPHEVGIFLGYPIEDVIGFIEKRECKWIGCWKVYGDVQKAKRQFDQIHQCMTSYRTMVQHGIAMQSAIVSDDKRR